MMNNLNPERLGKNYLFPAPFPGIKFNFFKFFPRKGLEIGNFFPASPGLNYSSCDLCRRGRNKLLVITSRRRLGESMIPMTSRSFIFNAIEGIF